MIVIAVMIMIMPPPALPPYLFELLMTPVGLSTVFTVALPGNAQSFFSFMNAPFTPLMAIGAGWHR
ncbi:MAG TPA: hypothetical protein VEK84_06210 [Terriglobales bacterium]|nr:hypothetical protein [Terriglobales bacterium]